MSLINQMLHDLEQRRTAEAGTSPLGGLSASGSVAQSVHFSINYATLTIIVAVVFVAGVVVAYLLGSQYQLPTTETVISPSSKKEITVSAGDVIPAAAVPHNLLVTKAAVINAPEKVALETVAEVVVDASVAETLSKKTDISDPPVEEQFASIIINSIPENVFEEKPVESKHGINKTIRPLTLEQQSQQAFQRAVRLLGSDDQSGAKRALEKSLLYSPAHLRARETLVAILLNNGRVSEAANTLRDGLRLMPGAASLAKLYARILVDQGDVSEAVKVLERARPAVAADPEYYALLAALYRQEKKYSQSAQLYQQILVQRPGVASWWMGLALSQDAMGDSEKAIDAFQRAQRVGGLNTQVLKYIQSRIVALTPVAPIVMDSSNDAGPDSDEFEE